MASSAETELFRGYENDYFELSNKIKRQLAEVQKQSGEQGKRTLQQVDKNVERADKLVKDMEYEASSIVTRDIREKLLQKVKTFKSDTEKLRSDWKQRRDALNNKKSTERDNLLGAQKDEFQIANEDYRNRLIYSTKSLERTSESVQRSMQILDESEQIGIQTADDVRRQGEQLRSTRDRLQDTNQELTSGSRLIGRMSRRQITNRIILILIILIMLVVIGIILFFIIRPYIPKPKPKPGPSPSPPTPQPSHVNQQLLML